MNLLKKRLAKEIWKSNRMKYFHIKIEYKHAKDAKYCKDRDHCFYTGEYRGAPHTICDLKCCVPKEIPIIFDNGSI